MKLSYDSKRTCKEYFEIFKNYEKKSKNNCHDSVRDILHVFVISGRHTRDVSIYIWNIDFLNYSNAEIH